MLGHRTDSFKESVKSWGRAGPGRRAPLTIRRTAARPPAYSLEGGIAAGLLVVIAAGATLWTWSIDSGDAQDDE
jgi:hypothetical protein